MDREGRECPGSGFHFLGGKDLMGGAELWRWEQSSSPSSVPAQPGIPATCGTGDTARRQRDLEA